MPNNWIPSAQGLTGRHGTVNLCFTTPDHEADLSLFALWGAGTSNGVGLAVRVPAADTSCDHCCAFLAALTYSVQENPLLFCLDHPFTRLHGCGSPPPE